MMLRPCFVLCLGACSLLLGCGSSDSSSSSVREATVKLVQCDAPSLPSGQFEKWLRAGPNGTLYVSGDDAQGTEQLRRYRPSASSAGCAFELDDTFGQGGMIADVDAFDVDASGEIHATAFGGSPLATYDSNGKATGSCDVKPAAASFLAVSPDGNTRYVRSDSENELIDASCGVSTWQAPSFVDKYIGPTRISDTEMFFAHQDVAYLTDRDGNLEATLRGGKFGTPESLCYANDIAGSDRYVDVLDSSCAGVLRFDHSGKIVAAYAIPQLDPMAEVQSFAAAADGNYYALITSNGGVGLYRLDGLSAG